MANPQDDPTVFVDIPGPSENIPDQADGHDGGAINSASQQSTNVVNSSLTQLAENGTASVDSMAPSQNERLLRKRSGGPAKKSLSAPEEEFCGDPSDTSDSMDDDDDDDSGEDEDATNQSHSVEGMPRASTQRHRRCKPKFVLAGYLPKEAPKQSLNIPDELRESLLSTVKQNLRGKTFSDELSQADFSIDPGCNYFSQLVNNWFSLRKILCCTMTELEEKGVTKVGILIIPQVALCYMPNLLEQLPDNVHFDRIKIPLKSTDEDVVSYIPKVVAAIKPYSVPTTTFTFPEGAFADLKDKSHDWLQLKKNTMQIFLPNESFPTIRFGRRVLVGPTTKRTDPFQLKRKKKSGTPKVPKQQIVFTTDGNFYSIQEVGNRITAYEYWNLKSIHERYKGKEMVVAIVDSGVELSHIAFKTDDSGGNKILYSHNFAEKALDCSQDPHGHGTFCAGIVCGNFFQAYENPNGQDGKKVPVQPGVAPEAKLVVCKVTCGDKKDVQVKAVVDALEYIKDNYTGPNAEHRVDVVSLSFTLTTYSSEVATAISSLVCNNVIVVCAASNRGHTHETSITYPARFGNVLCIGSHGDHGKSSSFSPVGQDLDFLAPGENILSASSSGSLRYPNQATCGSGTSFAAPAVAGLICLILECLKNEHRSEAEKFHNHFVMKDLLRKMSTNGSTHSNERGFGTLLPNQFFRNPDLIVQNLKMDILEGNTHIL